MKVLKKWVKDLFTSYQEGWMESISSFKQINWKDFFLQMLSNLLICISFALFCGLREGNGDLYMSIFIPVFFANTLVILYACMKNASKKMALLLVFLMTTGTALQIFMMPAYEVYSLSEAKSYVTMVFIGIITSVIVIPFVKFLNNKEGAMKGAIGFLFGMSMITYLALFLLGTEVNGTKAWFYLGGMSFQLTELTKLFTFMMLPMIIQCPNMSEKKKSLVSFIFLMINALFLILLNELGTLVMICFVTFLGRMIFTKSKKYVLTEALSCVLLASVALGLCFGAYKMTAKEPTETTQEVASITTDETSFVDEMLERLGQIYPKIETRVKVFLNSEDVDAKYTYQNQKANEALTLVSYFGTPRGSLAAVPEIGSDFVFVYLLVRLGLVGAALVLISLIVMLSEVIIAGSKVKGNMSEYMMSFLFVSAIVLQALLCSCSSIGLFPIVGLPFPFLSNGGTALCVNLFMVMFTISYLQKNKMKEDFNNASES